MVRLRQGSGETSPLDVRAIQTALAAERLDGWLLYDFHGSNPIAQQLAGLNGGRHMTTRRWYYLIPASGEPRGLVHAIERQALAHLPGAVDRYAGREQLEAGPVVGCRERGHHAERGAKGPTTRHLVERWGS